MYVHIITAALIMSAATVPAGSGWAQALWHLAAPVVVGLLAWMGHALLNYVLWWSAQEDWSKWAVTNPKKAFVVRLLRIFGPHIRSVGEAWSKYLADQAKLRGVDPSKMNPPT